MIGIDERQAELAGLGDLPDDIGDAARVNPNCGNKIRDQRRNLEPDWTSLVNAAMRLAVRWSRPG